MVCPSRGHVLSLSSQDRYPQCGRRAPPTHDITQYIAARHAIRLVRVNNQGNRIFKQGV